MAICLYIRNSGNGLTGKTSAELDCVTEQPLKGIMWQDCFLNFSFQCHKLTFNILFNCVDEIGAEKFEFFVKVNWKKIYWSKHWWITSFIHSFKYDKYSLGPASQMWGFDSDEQMKPYETLGLQIETSSGSQNV